MPLWPRLANDSNPDWSEQVKRMNADDGVVGLRGHPCGLFGFARFLLGFLDQP